MTLYINYTNKYLVASICSSNITEEVVWQTVSSVGSLTPNWFSSWFLLKAELCSSTASGRGNILARTDATLEAPKPHTFGPSLKKQSQSTSQAWWQTHQLRVNLWVFCLFVYFIICISQRKFLRHTCPVFHLNFCSFFRAFFDTGFKCFTFTNKFIFLVSHGTLKYYVHLGKTEAHMRCLWRRGTYFLSIYWHSWHAILSFHLEKYLKFIPKEWRISVSLFLLKPFFSPHSPAGLSPVYFTFDLMVSILQL